MLRLESFMPRNFQAGQKWVQDPLARIRQALVPATLVPRSALRSPALHASQTRLPKEEGHSSKLASVHFAISVRAIMSS